MSQPPTIELYKGDLPKGRFSGRSIAIDTETLGLNPYRDRLCLVQLSRGDGNAELVQLRRHYEAPELKRLLAAAKEEGDLFLFTRLCRILKVEPTAEEWLALGGRAEERGKLAFAQQAYRKGGKEVSTPEAAH